MFLLSKLPVCRFNHVTYESGTVVQKVTLEYPLFLRKDGLKDCSAWKRPAVVISPGLGIDKQFVN
jgi:hypothetical protein